MSDDDAWLVSKQAQYLKDIIEARTISIELLECLSHLMKEVLDEASKKEIATRPNTAHLITRTRQLLEESTRVTGTLLLVLIVAMVISHSTVQVSASPNGLLQRPKVHAPNVDVTLPYVR
jgi:adenosyl cobinamide kinase/adenosyl cobinamide phosphate guanylyltransferase